MPPPEDDTDLSLSALDKVPNPPDWLPNAHAVKEWKRLAKELVANKRLTEANLSGLGHLCSLHGKIVQLWAAGECPTGFLMSQYRSMINDYCITPAASSRTKPVLPNKNAPDRTNPFSRNGRPIG